MPYIPLFLHAEVVKFGKGLDSLGFKIPSDNIVINSRNRTFVLDATGQKIQKARLDESRQLVEK